MKTSLEIEVVGRFYVQCLRKVSRGAITEHFEVGEICQSGCNRTYKPPSQTGFSTKAEALKCIDGLTE